MNRRATFILTIHATSESRTIYPEHESGLFAAIERRTGLDETMARTILRGSSIKHPDMTVESARPRK